MIAPVWKIWIDTGGTFTDCIAIDPKGQFSRLKILSHSVLRGKILKRINRFTVMVDIQWPSDKEIYDGYFFRIVGNSKIFTIAYADVKNNLIFLEKPLPKQLTKMAFELCTEEEVPVLAARLLTKTPLQIPFPKIEMKLGSTRGTNAILERKGARTAFLVTKGFSDLLLIGNQQRPDLFALNIQKPKPLYERVFEIDERIEADGTILKPVSVEEINRIIKLLKKQKVQSIAVAFLNSYKNPTNESFVATQLKSAGYSFVSVSHELSQQVRILPRAETSVANAYLAPIIHNYLTKIQAGLAGATLKVMTSAGGLVSANNFFPKDSLLSGPAGGVVGAATQGKKSGVTRLITFDMGGTSTDVSLYNDHYDYRYESKVGEQKILSPSLAIETIAAGGGSICDFDGYRFTVGPHSAGASPGPACYGAGGPLTITDVNLLLGKLDPANFAIPLNATLATQALKNLLQKVKKATGRKYSFESVLQSLAQIANEKMADAIKKVSVQHGYNPSDYTLLCFGGAGGQHACQLGEILGMKKVLIPYDAGLLSAYGIGHADVERFEEKLVLEPLSKTINKLNSILTELKQKGEAYLKRDGFSIADVKLLKQLLFLRFKGQESTIEININPFSETDLSFEKIKSAFRKKYESIFGHWLEEKEIELESVKVSVCVRGHSTPAINRVLKNYTPRSIKKQKLLVGKSWHMAPVFRWEELNAGARIIGPAILVSNNSTSVVEKGWTLVLDQHNNALVTKKAKLSSSGTTHSREAMLELFTNRFTSIAQEMGALLQRTSFSVNVKERLDFSCALLDPEGYLVVNAPHIPVHLGSLGVCVREVKSVIDMTEGDVIITNHPGFGGSHLPDVTLIKPVFYKRKLVGYVANRAHHAEIGGMKPGSMPANATTLEEEGVIIKPQYLVRKGNAQWNEIKSVFTSVKYPTRLLDENMADLNGALASVNFGEKLLQELCQIHSDGDVIFYMKALRTYAKELLTEKLKSLPVTSFTAIEKLDDGSPLSVTMRVKKGKLRIDFTGSADAHPRNLNATKAIVQSVILYVLRVMVNKPIPMNEGMMDCVDVILPHGLLNPKFSGEKHLPAVVGGNTEVSQRLTDTLLKALGIAACSQGTMNNFLFGNKSFGYYETICGGTGAGPGFDGASGVHQHMTNTRITDPELLELRYPVRLNRFELRKSSGGKGKWNGGEGIVREFFFKEALEVNLLSQHRIEKPYGCKGGKAGKTGEQIVITNDGLLKHLKGMDSIDVAIGDRLIIKTPGGGGWGK